MSFIHSLLFHIQKNLQISFTCSYIFYVLIFILQILCQYSGCDDLSIELRSL